MAKTSTNIRIDLEVKKQAQEIFSELGLDMTTAVNIFLRQVIQYHGFPFDVRLNTPNPITIEAIDQGDRMERDPDTRRFKSVEELFADLDDEEA